MFRVCKKQQRGVRFNNRLAIQVYIFRILISNNLFAHEGLAVLQMVPLHDGGAVKFCQGMCTPAETKK